jgi:WD40 repeat protein
MGWPLILSLVNRYLHYLVHRLGISLPSSAQRVLDKLRHGGLDSFSGREPIGARSGVVGSTIRLSINVLPLDDQERYRSLAVFPAGLPLPIRIIAKYWGTNSSEAETICERLFSLSLVQSVNLEIRTVVLHDVFRRHLTEEQSQEMPQLHRKLLRNTIPSSGNWSDLPLTDTYLWRNLAHHHFASESLSSFRDLLLHFPYLQGKLSACGLNALLEDFEWFTGDSQINALRGAIRLSSDALTKDTVNLPSHISGRLLHLSGSDLARLLDSTRQWAQTPWFRPITPSFTGPDGPLVRTIDAHKAPITSMAAVDKNYFASSSLDGVKLWNVTNWESVPVAKVDVFGVSTLAVLPDRRIVIGSLDGWLQIWDTELGKLGPRLERHQKPLRCIVCINEETFVTAADDNKLLTWNMTGEFLGIFANHTSPIKALAMIGTDYLAGAAADGTIRVWDVATRQLVGVLPGHVRAVTCLVPLSGVQLVSGSDDRTVRTWDVYKQTYGRLLGKHYGQVKSLVSVGGTRVVSASSDRLLKVWDIKSDDRIEMKAFADHTDSVEALTILDEDTVISGCRDGRINVWNLSDSRLQSRRPNKHTKSVRRISLVSDELIASASDDRTIRLWEVKNGTCLRILRGHSDWIRDVVGLNKNYVLSCSEDRTLRLWKLSSGRTGKIWHGHSDGVRTVRLLNREHAISYSADRSLILWSVPSGRPVLRIRGEGTWASTFAVLDKNKIVTSTFDGTMRVWDLENHIMLRKLEGHTAWVTDIARIDERRIVSSSFDGSIRIFDAERGVALRTIIEHADTVAVLDTSHIVSVGQTVRLWDIDTGACVAAVNLDKPALSVCIAQKNPAIVSVGDVGGNVHFLELMGFNGRDSPRRKG